MKTFELTVTVPLTEEDITDIIVTALEGGIGYWAMLDNTTKEFEELYKTTKLSTSEITALILLNGGYVVLIDEEENEPYTLTLDKLINGIQRYLGEGGTLVNYDALDADAIIQYSLFNEVVFC